jgi:hypothetical protein
VSDRTRPVDRCPKFAECQNTEVRWIIADLMYCIRTIAQLCLRIWLDAAAAGGWWLVAGGFGCCLRTCDKLGSVRLRASPGAAEGALPMCLRVSSDLEHRTRIERAHSIWTSDWK